MKQHVKMCVENSEDVFEARNLSLLLKDDIQHRIKKYSFHIIKSSKNYIEWLQEDYRRRLLSKINQHFHGVVEDH